MNRSLTNIARYCGVAAVVAYAGASTGVVHAQQVVAPYSSNYTLFNLGSVPGVPTPYGGLTLDVNDPNVLLIGGNANAASGRVYRIAIDRNDCGDVAQFLGNPTSSIPAPNIDGGLAFGPGGVLFSTGYPTNTIHQSLPGSTVVNRSIDLNPLGVASSTGTLAFAPNGDLKIASYNASTWYSAQVVLAQDGTYDIVNVQQRAQLVGGPEGIAYVPPGSFLFPNPAVLISEYGSAQITAYDVDANYDPIPSTRRVFATGIAGAEGAFVDPTTGNFLFSTFGGGNRVLSIRGFAVTTPVCDAIDFNGDGLFPDDSDLVDFLSVLAGGACSTGTCNDIDFNNDCLFPDDSDLLKFLSVLAGADC
jgi:hypothetical protein